MVRRLLAEDGLLMQADPALPSVTTLVAGKPIEGSWWGHASGRAIFAVCEALDDDPDVLATRLVNGKVTFVHRRLWSSLLAMATSGEGWQLDGLSREAKRLLARIRSSGSVKAASTAPARRVRTIANAAMPPTSSATTIAAAAYSNEFTIASSGGTNSTLVARSSPSAS